MINQSPQCDIYIPISPKPSSSLSKQLKNTQYNLITAGGRVKPSKAPVTLLQLRAEKVNTPNGRIKLLRGKR